MDSVRVLRIGLNTCPISKQYIDNPENNNISVGHDWWLSNDVPKIFLIEDTWLLRASISLMMQYMSLLRASPNLNSHMIFSGCTSTKRINNYCVCVISANVGLYWAQWNKIAERYWHRHIQNTDQILPPFDKPRYIVNRQNLHCLKIDGACICLFESGTSILYLDAAERQRNRAAIVFTEICYSIQKHLHRSEFTHSILHSRFDQWSKSF